MGIERAADAHWPERGAHNGNTTRYRDHANHMQNNTFWWPSTPEPGGTGLGCRWIISAERPARVAPRVFAHPSHSLGLYEHLCDPRPHECRPTRAGSGVSHPHRQHQGVASRAAEASAFS